MIQMKEHNYLESKDFTDKDWFAHGITQKQLDLTKITRIYPPVDFAKSIQQQKHAYLTRFEERIINELIEDNKLPSEILNMAIHYVLVEDNQRKINPNYLKTIVNDWAQNHIETPEEAILYVKRRNQKLANSYKKRK